MSQRPTDEVSKRRDRLREWTNRRGLDGVCLFGQHAVTYFSGFLFVPTERPIALCQTVDGESSLIVPYLEAQHARAEAEADTVATYDEFPGETHPMRVLALELERIGLGRDTTRLGVDFDGYPPVWGYWGPALSEQVPAKMVASSRAMDELMLVKSPWEIAMLRESSRWACRAHELLMAYTVEGANETEVSQRASADATIELAAAVPNYRGGQMLSGAHAGYRGQIGRRGALPHTMGLNLRFQVGDTLVTGATAPMWGYVSELERTMFLGEPGPEQTRMFDQMLAMQSLCMETIRPGVAASDVDLAMRAYVDANGLWPLWRHHVGHGIGLRYHEAPFLDQGDPTLLEPGMVVTVEPGLYDPSWGGFRHSDTVVVTPQGHEVLTAGMPRDLARLVLPAGQHT